jgi:uncharacterized protein (TIGR03435 family)
MTAQCRSVLLVVLFAVASLSPAQEKRLAFEVASVRPAAAGESAASGIQRPAGAGQFRATNVTLRMLLGYAYDIAKVRHDPEPVGGPSWMEQDRFSITARASDSMSTEDSRRMLRSLLEDRFHLRAHIDMRETPVYVLTLARRDQALGTGLKRSQTDCTVYSETLAETGSRESAEQKGGTKCGLSAGGPPQPDGSRTVRGRGMLADIINLIGSAGRPEVDRPIIDKTGLTGTFDIELHWMPDRPRPGPVGAVSTPIEILNIFTAVQEQLGLKLEAQRRPYRVLVIDSVERPSPN